MSDPVMPGDKVMDGHLFSLTQGFDPRMQQTVLALKLNFSWRPPNPSEAPYKDCAQLSRIIATGERGSDDLWLDEFDGISLESLMTQGPLPLPDSFAILRQIAAALDHLHTFGHIHGALRPSSILVGAGLDVRIVDWMIGWNDVPPSLIAAASEYFSPEKLSDLPEGSHADQFALGTIAHQLLLGRTPFPADGLAEKLFRIRYGLWDDGATGEIEFATHGVYDRVFAIDPEERFANCSAFVDALEKASRQRSYSETRLIEVEENARPSASESHADATLGHTFPAAWWVAAAAIALVACVMGIWTWHTQNQIDELGDRLGTQAVLDPASADLSRNGMFTVCNSSPAQVDIRELAVGYWDQNHKLQIFNSSQYTQEGWKVAPSSSQLFSWPPGQKTVWDGSVLFYFVRVRQEQKEYVVSGRWDANAQGCLHLPS
jgi:serine/threonine protein kinase